MKKVRQPLASILVLLSFVAISCMGSAEDSHQSAIAPSSGQLEFTAIPTKERFTLGEPITLRLRLKNTTSESLLIIRTLQLSMTVWVRATDLDRRSEVKKCSPIVPEFLPSSDDFSHLAPGAAVESEVVISCHGQEPNRQYGFDFSQPSSYQVQAKYRITLPAKILKKIADRSVVVTGPVEAPPVKFTVAADPAEECALPPGLRDEISEKYPGTKVLSLADLEEYHRQMYQKDHGTRCPGLVRVNFYGDGNPTWALVLIAGENPNQKAELVVVRQVGDAWETRSLETTDGTPVVWREGPGKYEDVYGKKVLCAPNPVIVFVGYESWGIVYAWTGEDVEKIWISD